MTYTYTLFHDFLGMVKGYHWLCPAILGRKEDADFLGRSQFLWLVNSLPLICCRAHMEKHIQAWRFGWASLIFPYQQKWKNTLGKRGDNTAVHFADDRLCLPSGHHHLSLSPIPVGWIFFLSYRVIFTATNTFQWDSSQSTGANAQFGEIENETRPL